MEVRQSHFDFTASQVTVEAVDGALVVALGQSASGEPPYLTLRRAPGGAAEQAAYSIEINDQSQSCIGGIEGAVLARTYLGLRFSEAAGRLLEGLAACKVRFPPAEQRSVYLPEAERRFEQLGAAVRALFSGTSAELVYGLDKPSLGPPNCRLNAREKRQLGWNPVSGWEPVSHCSKCDHMVFLAQNDADAEALGRLGQCVKLTEGCQGKVIFIGLMHGCGPGEHSVLISVALPDELTGLRERALEGVRLYLNRLRNFNESLALLLEGREVLLPPMSWNEARELRRRLEDWHLQTRCIADPATTSND